MTKTMDMYIVGIGGQGVLTIGDFVSEMCAKNGIDAFLEILYGYNPASVGGELPDESFYYGYNSK